VARLNISLPDDLYELANKWRDSLNLSEICARALRDELSAAESGRSIPDFFRSLAAPTAVETRLAEHYGLFTARVCDTPARPGDLRDRIGRHAATFIEAEMFAGLKLAICGGRQMWSVVRHLTPRAISVAIEAIGIGQHDPSVLHAHPNTLVTLLSLLFAPRSSAKIISDADDASTEGQPRPTWLLASCAPLTSDGPLSSLLDPENIGQAIASGAVCDFAYQFLRRDGSGVSVPFQSSIRLHSLETLQAMAASQEHRVILIAGGDVKLEAIRIVLSHRLCNVLITDEHTAQSLC
jgi:DNA-binding transcriptional regulator LsrR (DeoR family)